MSTTTASSAVFPPPPPVPIPTYITSLGLGYSIAIALGFLVLISTIILSSYICCRASRLRFSASTATANANANASFGNRSVIVPRIIFVAEEDDDLESATTVVSGLDQVIINSYPKFLFTKEIATVGYDDAFNGGDGETICSICLCEYEEEEMLRMMPECKHYFHVYCLDAWLKLNGSCPVCRNSPFPTPQSTPQSTPLSEDFADMLEDRTKSQAAVQSMDLAKEREKLIDLQLSLQEERKRTESLEVELESLRLDENKSFADLWVDFLLKDAEELQRKEAEGAATKEKQDTERTRQDTALSHSEFSTVPLRSAYSNQQLSRLLP